MSDDDGSAALEFIAVGVILLVPLVYLIIALGAVQEQTLGVEAAARHTARAIALAPDAAAAAVRSERVLASISDQYGIDAESIDVSVTCVPAEGTCPSAGATVTVTVATSVSLPLIPAVFGMDEAASVRVEGSAVQKMSRLWGGG
ncbi:TadE family protein [Microbacterium sp. APC 3901]|uniref:TadE family protein n=1 Tax=Microbacterium sp. APC 3901 TaxID=3035192 RepID=UPI0025B32EB0|nr:TadE family protein [Microbacterium sp. APC 3901]MDN3443763.1 TadE family protein [Microbacterium sp. APC 3901]